MLNYPTNKFFHEDFTCFTQLEIVIDGYRPEIISACMHLLLKMVDLVMFGVVHFTSTCEHYVEFFHWINRVKSLLLTYFGKLVVGDDLGV